jgi:hypothetical protein
MRTINRFQWPVAIAIACAVFLAPVPMGGAIAASEIIAYGLGEGITESQAVAADNLAWPQSYEAVLARFGYPDLRDEQSDWYQAPNGQYLRIFYNSDNTAIDRSWEDSI